MSDREFWNNAFLERLRYQALLHYSKPLTPIIDDDRSLLAMEFIKARYRFGLSQNELAKLTRTSQSVISSIETKKGNPSLSTMVKIASALNVRLTLVE